MTDFTMNEARDTLRAMKANTEAFVDKQKSRFAEFTEKQGELQARLQECEQQLARRGSGGDRGGGPYYDASGATLRAVLDGSAELKAVADRKRRRCVVDLPPGYFQAAAVTSTGVTLPQQMPGIVGGVERRMTVRALLPSIPVTSGALTYVQETGFDNQADVVSETIEKPESTLTFEIETANIRVIAHWTKASVPVLQDTPLLQDFIGRRLRYGLQIVEEAQLLRGSGVGQNLPGLYTNATAFTGSTSGTKIDILRRAAEQLEVADYLPSGYVLHPSDWSAIDLIKSTVSEEYVLGMPSRTTAPTLWGLPCVITNSMTQGTFLCGDFQQSALLLDRMEPRLDVSTEDGDNFRENMATLRVEERIGLAILRPGGLIKGTFPADSP